MSELYVQPDRLISKSQRAVRKLTNDMLASTKLSSAYDSKIIPIINPLSVVADLEATPLQSLLLQEGESLSAEQPNGRYHDLKLLVSPITLASAALQVERFTKPKYGVMPLMAGGANELSFHPGKLEIDNEVSIRLRYTNGNSRADQIISAIDLSDSAGDIATLARKVWSIDYAESGYERHNRLELSPPSEDAVIAFIGICRNILKNKTLTNN